MRIVGGHLKGRNLATPAGQSTRPTSDRVRESIFNILAHGIEGFTLEDTRVLDLFAGTGALGFEALSRGARWCHFVEEATPARALIRTNADKLGLIGHCKIWRRDATDLGLCAPLPKFDVAFADPPYGKGLGEKALRSLVAGEWMNEGSVIVLEEAENATVPDIPSLTLLDERAYGETKVYFYSPSPLAGEGGSRAFAQDG
jgi:16S rRNA (guanine966-N2)-methyltransferase